MVVDAWIGKARNAAMPVKLKMSKISSSFDAFLFASRTSKPEIELDLHLFPIGKIHEFGL